jgi:hypothetical protein
MSGLLQIGVAFVAGVIAGSLAMLVPSELLLRQAEQANRKTRCMLDAVERHLAKINGRNGRHEHDVQHARQDSD